MVTPELSTEVMSKKPSRAQNFPPSIYARYGYCGFHPKKRNAAKERRLVLGEDGSLNEWAIIELQGDLKHSTGHINNAQFIGDLHFTESGVPILIIGIHVLYGKEIALSKPFAVLEKIKSAAVGGEKTDMETEDCESTTEYIVKAIVKKKLIFKGRPKPIVTDVPICT